MADTDKKNLSPADEIEELKRQMEAMHARLMELSAVMAQDAQDQRVDERAVADEGVRAQEPSAAESLAADAAAPSAFAADAADAAVVIEPVAAPEPAAAASEAAQPYAAYVPPSAPASYAASQPADSGAPTPPPAYDASAANASHAAASGVEYGQPTGQQAYQSNGYAGGYGASAQTPYSPYGQYYQQPVVRTKDHVAAGLLGIFLGTFGIHKFYLGYNTSGFIMLGVAILGGLLSLGLATGVVWLIGLIEGIIYLVKGQVEFEQAYVFGKREWF